jgi:hypothetical protein
MSPYYQRVLKRKNIVGYNVNESENSQLYFFRSKFLLVFYLQTLATLNYCH